MGRRVYLKWDNFMVYILDAETHETLDGGFITWEWAEEWAEGMGWEVA